MKKQAMKAELTSGTRGKFYRKSTPSSRIKKAAKKMGKTALGVLTSGTSIATGFGKKVKKSPAKFIRTGGSSITKNKLGKKINKVMEKGIKKIIDVGVQAYKNPKSMATGFGGLKKKSSPALAKLSASCKAAAKRKFKVYPSAY